MKKELIIHQGTQIVDEVTIVKNYTKVNIFTLAHTMTKSIIQPGDDYKVTFGLVLKCLYQDITITLKELCQKLHLNDKKARRVLRKQFTKHEKWAWQGVVPDTILNTLKSIA